MRIAMLDTLLTFAVVGVAGIYLFVKFRPGADRQDAGSEASCGSCGGCEPNQGSFDV
ncbi:hypothetical protein [Sulfidibacter corallicola]|uniref:FeoB-associated Cys-rich membrane protein n=1 Tax=Sulfidibacter corallicola TaxID=2818388 RepID=A0A8A4TMU8_SULCO|nr:hypothetical protein [Sulfidibacter corallicola]QTD50873.1 hypothetical protein J3U87_00260 [Sulfidibacter corallicola]